MGGGPMVFVAKIKTVKTNIKIQVVKSCVSFHIEK